MGFVLPSKPFAAIPTKDDEINNLIDWLKDIAEPLRLSPMLAMEKVKKIVKARALPKLATDIVMINSNGELISKKESSERKATPNR